MISFSRDNRGKNITKVLKFPEHNGTGRRLIKLPEEIKEKRMIDSEIALAADEIRDVDSATSNRENWSHGKSHPKISKDLLI